MAFEFFTILLSNSLKKLRLPGKFARVFDGHEPFEVKLREAGRRHRLWDVEVVFDAEGHIYLGRGWEQFAGAHDLRLGHFLVLSYGGRHAHAMLTVKVFDGSMCRRDYRNDNDASSGSSGDSGNTLFLTMYMVRLLGQQGAEGEGEVPPQTEAEEGDGEQGVSKMSNPCDSDGSQKGRSYSSEKLSEDSLFVDNSVASANLQTLSCNYVLSTQCYLTKAQKVKIDALMEKIEPKFTVLVVQMKKSNVKQHATLTIHKDYALKHFPYEDTTVILQLPGKNKDWKCTFRIRPSGTSDAGRRNLFLYNFAYDNHIREGDICLFQPITNVKQRTFIVTVHVLHKVSIDHYAGGRTDIGSNHGRKRAKMGAVKDKPRTDEDNSLESDRQKLSKYYVLSGQCYLTEAQEVKMLALVKKIRPEIPVLVVQMKKSNVNNSRTLAICKDYTLEHLPCGETVIILQLPRKNKVWKCKLYNRPSRTSDAGRRNLYLGNFVRDNPVREGDICLFQPMTNVKQKRFTMTVHLLSKTSVNHSPGARNGIGSNHGRTSTKKAGDVEEPPTDGEEYSSEHEDHEISDDSKGGSEPPFMLADRASLTRAQEKKVLEKVEEIESDVPLYVAIMSKSNVYRGSGCNTPTLHFGYQYTGRYLVQKSAAGYHRGKSSLVSLVLHREGRSGSWPTKMQHSMQHTTHAMRVLKGWTFFARDNRLREGDLCLFKLIKNKEPLTMVIHIIRREEY
ncbi:hypothetical protein VPH35_063176 [Triticum aestivum]